MKPYRPTKKMLTVLRDVIEGRGTHHLCHGLSEHGGRDRIVNALRRHGFLDRQLGPTMLGNEWYKSQTGA